MINTIQTANTSTLDEETRQLITGSLPEVDAGQIAIYRRLTPAQRVQQAVTLSDWLREANQRRLAHKENRAMSAQPFISIIEFARIVIEALEAAQVEYMLAGALSVAAWGEARSTQDVDIVVDVPVENMARLSQELTKRGMLVPHDVILDNFLLEMQTDADLPVNAIEPQMGYKAELFLVKPNDEYRRVAFSRRRLVELPRPLGEVYVHAPEDLILNKLRYFKISHQPKHTRDIKSIMLAMEDEWDVHYIEQWAERLAVKDVWREMQRLVETKRQETDTT